jgi:hypothetical protein
LEKIGKLDPAKLVLAGDGDAAALKEIDAILIEESQGADGASCSGRPWARTCSRGAAPKSNSSTVTSLIRGHR